MATQPLDKVRLRFYCTGCCPGYHLPYIAAKASGLFAQYGLDVDFSEPTEGSNVESVANGEVDFCLTSVLHLLKEKTANPELAARFVAIVMPKSPISALVADDSPIRTPIDLVGRRVAGNSDNHHVVDFQAAMASLGLEPLNEVDGTYGDAPAALGRGDVDIVADFAELVPRTRRQAGIKVRPVRLELDIYASGLVAADRLPNELVGRMRDAIVAALEFQHRDPTAGLEAFSERYPNIDPADALEGWELMEPSLFTDGEVGSMNAERWDATIQHVATNHKLPVPAPETVYNPDFVGVPAAAV